VAQEFRGHPYVSDFHPISASIPRRLYSSNTCLQADPQGKGRLAFGFERAVQAFERAVLASDRLKQAEEVESVTASKWTTTPVWMHSVQATPPEDQVDSECTMFKEKVCNRIGDFYL
jgi:hypothetical protein